jgi:hypothetical protein
VFAVLWGGVVALAVHGLIAWQEPGLLLRGLLAYLPGAYVALPGLRLRGQPELTPEGARLYRLVPLISVLVYAGASVALGLIR